MTEDEKQILKKELSIMANIANYARECNAYYHRLRNPGKNIFIQSPDIDFLKSVLFSTMVLEVCKLFKVNTSKNDKHLFLKLINRFDSGDLNNKEFFKFCSKAYNEFIKSKLTEEYIDDTESLKNISHEDFIRNIILLRDKLIAHLDKEEDIELEIQFQDVLIGLDNCISFACNFLEELHLKVFDESMKYESAYFGKTNFELLDAFIEKRYPNYFIQSDC
jgi:hypothetical protein